MEGHVELFLEDDSGQAIDDAPAWRAASRQFLWEVVHDTRGFLRRSIPANHVNRIRTVDTAGAEPGPALAADAVAESYRAALQAARERQEDGPHFHWLSPGDEDDWAVVQHVETEGGAVTVVGGWSRPLVRGGPEGDEPASGGAEPATLDVAGTRLRVRRESYYDLFHKDLERLVEALDEAARRGLRARFKTR